MKIFFLHIFFLAGLSVSSAQSGCTIKKAYAYYNVSMPGAQMADENGNPIPPKPIITRIIYVEYSGSKIPDIKSVLYNNIPLDYTVIKINAKTVSIGYKNLNPGNIIKAKKGNSLLQIDLQPFEGKTMPDVNCKSITLKTKVAGKICTFNILSEKEFFAPPRY
jgi:hypothetical protein